LAKSHEIFLKSDFGSIVEEIHESFEHNVKEISEKILSNMAISHATEDKKNVVVYYYNNDKVSIHFKALSSLRILQEDFVFLALFNPSE
jgi:hypothetical protein